MEFVSKMVSHLRKMSIQEGFKWWPFELFEKHLSLIDGDPVSGG